MGQLAKPSSAYHQPLDSILGSPATVRVLRVLSNHGGYLSATEVSERAELNRVGTKRVLESLVETRFVERSGRARSVLYHLGEANYLAPAIQALFRHERERMDGVGHMVRELAERVQPVPIAVWHFGSAARAEDRFDSDYDLALIGDARLLAQQKEQFSSQLFEAAEPWLIQPSLISLSEEDVWDAFRGNTAFWQNLQQDCVVLFGKTPGQVVYGYKKRQERRSGRLEGASHEGPALPGQR